MHIIPAIDIIDGKCVRLTQGDYAQKKIYNEDPLEVAQNFEGAGIKRLHLVDLDGAKQKKIVNLKVLEKLAGNTSLQIDFGGGVQSDEDIEDAFNAGAHQITGGSIAVKDQELFLKWLQKFGSDKIILGADVKNENVAISGWQEEANWNIFSFLSHFEEKGVQYIICTDVSKDGLLMGPSIDLYKQILAKNPTLNLIASGGVSDKADLKKLSELGVYGAIVGKAFYEGRIKLEDIKEL